MSGITADSNAPRHGGWGSSLRTLFSPSRQSEDLTVDGPISSIELIGETAAAPEIVCPEMSRFEWPEREAKDWRF